MKTTQNHIDEITRFAKTEAEIFKQNILTSNEIFDANVDALIEDITAFSQKIGNMAYPRIDGIIDKITRCEGLLFQKRKLIKDPVLRQDESQSLAALSLIKSRIYEIRFLTIRKNEEEQFIKRTKKSSEEQATESQNAKEIVDGLAANKELLSLVNEKLPQLDNAISSKLKQIEDDYSEVSKHANEEKTKADEEFNKFKNFVLENTKNVKKLFDLASTESISNIYTTRSDQESRAANNFRNVAFLTMGVVCLIDILFIFDGLLSGFKGYQAFSVVTLSLMLLTPAIYLSKESTRHRKFEQENIKISQNIGAILSFISNLEEAERTKIIHSIAESLLKNMTPTAMDESSPNIHFNISEKILEKFKTQ